MSFQKTYCPLSNGPQFAYVEFFNRDWKSLVYGQSQLEFKVSVTEPSDAIKPRND